VDATLISTSRPFDVYRTPWLFSARSLPLRFTMAITAAPRALARSTVRLVSVVVPDWLMAMTRTSDISSASRKPDSSVAGTASARIGGRPLRSPEKARSTAAATLRPAIAAVPWPMT